jgi:hypothetical protein
MSIAQELQEQRLGRGPNRDEARFIEQAYEEGYEVEVYHGYSYRVSPAVRVNDDSELVDIIRATDMPVRWDGLGSGYIVYPLMGG